MRIKRLFILAVLAVAVAALATQTAQAHVRLKSSSPSKGGSASTSIRSVTATFTGPLRRGTIRVTGPGGRTVSIGSGGRDPRKVSRLRVSLGSALRSGSYTAKWTLVAADGHSQRGRFSFRLRG